MPIKFDIKLTSEDMYRFNMYHAYTSMQGILSLILGIFVIAVIAFSGDFHDFVSAAPYLLIAVIFFLYIPITLRLRSKRQIRMSPVLKDTLHFEMNDEGITVRSVGEEERQHCRGNISTRRLPQSTIFLFIVIVSMHT